MTLLQLLNANPMLFLFLFLFFLFFCLLFYKMGHINERDVWIDSAVTDITRKDFVTVSKHNYIVFTEDQYKVLLGIKFAE